MLLHISYLFQYYHERQCSQCHSVPQEISICLLCGTIVCLKQNCCKQMNVCEAIQVSILYNKTKM
jgi:E3 ubiquitin-protein ligase UBR3